MRIFTLAPPLPAPGREDILRLDTALGCLPGGEISLPKLFISLAAAGDMAYGKRDSLPDRDNLFRRHTAQPARIYYCHQKHTREVLLVGEGADPAEYTSRIADGLVAPSPRVGQGGISLCVTVADCLPIFLFDGLNGACGVVHSGWKGTGIAARAVRLMRRELGCRPENITAVIGPGIGSCCYAVPRERGDFFRERYGSETVTVRAGNCYLDLRAANRILLADEGIGTLVMTSHCTACADGFHSFRRDGADAFGLMLACLEKVPPK